MICSFYMVRTSSLSADFGTQKPPLAGVPLTLIELLTPLGDDVQAATIIGAAAEAAPSQGPPTPRLQTLVTAVCSCYDHGRKLLVAKAEELLKCGLTERDHDAFNRGLTLAAAACSASSSSCSYKDWFSAAFGASGTSLARDGAGDAGGRTFFSTFITFLERRVPEESSHMLACHINRPPFLPPAHKQVPVESKSHVYL